MRKKAMWPQMQLLEWCSYKLRNTKGCQQHQKLGRGKQASSPRAFRESIVLPTPWLPTFSLCEWRNFCCFKPPVLCYCPRNWSPEKGLWVPKCSVTRLCRAGAFQRCDRIQQLLPSSPFLGAGENLFEILGIMVVPPSHSFLFEKFFFN